MMKRPYLDEVQWARALAIFAVLIVHSTSAGIVGTAGFSLANYGYNFLNSAAKIGTSTFIFLSSFILFYSYYPRTLTKSLFVNFYKNRLLYILVPYVVFSIIYFWFKQNLAPSGLPPAELLALFLQQLATGNAQYHLYFVFVSVQFYLMFPVFLYLFKRFEWLRKWAIPIGILLQWGWVLANMHIFQIWGKGSISLSYFMFYFLGAFLGIYYEQFRSWLKSPNSRMVLVGIGLVYVTMTLGYFYVTVASRLGTAFFPTWVSELTWSTMAYTAGFLLFVIAHGLRRVTGKRTQAVLTEIGIVSFGIYLLHPLVLYYMETALPGGSPLVFHGWILVTFLTIFFGSWLVVRLVYQFVPFSWILFGKGSKLKRK